MSKLKIAIQKSGRLNEDSLKLLAACGINIDNGIDQLKVTATNFPLEVFFLRNSDIPQYLEDGVVDIAILGENLLIEEEKTLKIETYLGFSKCKLSIATPKGINYKSIKDLEGKKNSHFLSKHIKIVFSKKQYQCGITHYIWFGRNSSKYWVSRCHL
jgi:ATP phosphoribosyltransferase